MIPPSPGALLAAPASFDELELQTSDMAAKIDAAARVSRLPERPDEAALHRLCVDLVAEQLGR